MRVLHFYVPIANVSFDLTSGISAFDVINRISSFTRIQGYKDIYVPATLKCAWECFWGRYTHTVHYQTVHNTISKA